MSGDDMKYRRFTHLIETTSDRPQFLLFDSESMRFYRRPHKRLYMQMYWLNPDDANISDTDESYTLPKLGAEMTQPSPGARR